jgi:hypothetical protein
MVNGTKGAYSGQESGVAGVAELREHLFRTEGIHPLMLTFARVAQNNSWTGLLSLYRLRRSFALPANTELCLSSPSRQEAGLFG